MGARRNRQPHIQQQVDNQIADCDQAFRFSFDLPLPRPLPKHQAAVILTPEKRLCAPDTG